MERLSDEQLLRGYLRGDREALGLLAQRYERLLLGLARGLLNGSNTAALDAVQETWMRLMRYGKSFDGRSSVKTWLYRITINQCRDQLHQSRRRDADWKVAGMNGLEPAVADRDVSDGLARAERIESLRLRVAALSERRRETILLCYHEGLTHEQVAEVLEIPLGTVKSRLNAALEALRATFDEPVNT